MLGSQGRTERGGMADADFGLNKPWGRNAQA